MAQTALHTQPQPRRQPLRPVPVLERRQVELERELARQRLERQQPCGSACKSPHFSPAFTGEFCFWSCPLHPPNIFPISSIGTESAMYFLSSSDFVSHRTIISIFRASNFLIASRTYGSFSCRDRKLACVVASMTSTQRVSIRAPRVCRCVFGSIW